MVISITFVKTAARNQTRSRVAHDLRPGSSNPANTPQHWSLLEVGLEKIG
jgi:hypothetical protein